MRTDINIDPVDLGGEMVRCIITNSAILNAEKDGKIEPSTIKQRNKMHDDKLDAQENIYILALSV